VGDKLGRAVDHIRNDEHYTKDNPERREELNKRGFSDVIENMKK